MFVVVFSVDVDYVVDVVVIDVVVVIVDDIVVSVLV